ncbi:hypothetical protein BMT54_08355 [Pasteurellaceae bacterium 15-036681]|nr:hypothetical protein BMT54_08355 [Pasteurellaceae bacterium 15-036681]
MVKALLDCKDIQALGIASKSKLYEMIKKNQFPKPLKIGRFNRWHAGEVQKWLEAQHQKAQGEQGGIDGRLNA